MIREANVQDARSISQIKVNGWKTAYKGIVDDEFLNNMSYEENYEKVYQRLSDKDSAANVKTYVYEDDDTKEILGFVTFGEVYEKEKDYEYDSELYAIYVKPEEKGRGIGKELITFVKRYFKNLGYRNMILYCLKDNLPSRGFYERMGGVVSKEKENMIGSQLLKEVGYEYQL